MQRGYAMTGTVELDLEALASIYNRLGLKKGSESDQEDGRDVAASWTRFIADKWVGVSPINPVDMHNVLGNGFGVIGDSHQLLLVCQAVAATLAELCGFAEAEARSTSEGVRIFVRR
jgi:hypothetical protein